MLDVTRVKQGGSGQHFNRISGQQQADDQTVLLDLGELDGSFGACDMTGDQTMIVKAQPGGKQYGIGLDETKILAGGQQRDLDITAVADQTYILERTHIVADNSYRDKNRGSTSIQVDDLGTSGE